MSPSPAIPHINESKMKLYEMFAQKQVTPPPNLTHPAASTSALLGNHNNSNLFSYPSFQSPDLFTSKVEQMLIELDRLLRQSGNLPFTLLPPHHDIILVMRQIPLLINQSAQPTLLKSIVEKIVHQLYLSKTSLSVEVYCRFLQSLLELSPSISKETLSWFLYSEDERKNDVWIMTSLIKYGLIPLEEYDIKLSHQLNQQPTDNGLIEFITELLQNCLLTMQPITSIEEHVLVIHALQKLDSPKAKELIQDLEKKSNEAHRHLDQTNAFLFRFLFAEWTRVCRLHPANPAFYRQFSERILKTITYDTDKQCFFFRLCTEACVELYRPARSQSMDAYSKLIGLMVQAQEGYSAKLKMISQVFSVVVLVLAHHYEYQHVQFNQKPFLKLLCSLFVELNHTTSKDRDVNASLVIVYSDTLYTLEPLQFPGFAFSWLQLFSHRLFLPLLLSSEEGPQQTGHTICFKLMSAHLSFLSQLVQQRQSRRLSQSEKSFYQGTLRFLVVMLHDYPEFLCQHYHGLIQLLPVDCIQLRNLMLSSFPRTMILPNPFTTPLGYMATHSSPPELYTDASYYSINTFDFNLDCLDDYLSGSTTQLMGSSILQHLTHQGTLDPVYTQQFVFYVGTQAKLDITRSLSENPAVQIYKYLLSQLTDSKDKYTVLNAIVDHLRYPNSHTYFFSMALMHLFSTQSDIVKELITRVLLERLIVNRPHPWGLLTTFIQLIKEPLFTEHAFIKESMHRSPDIKRLFDNVLKSTQPMP